LGGVLPYTIDDAITDPLTCSVEVTIDFGGPKRWLFFATPQLLASVGDWVPGTRGDSWWRHAAYPGPGSPASPGGGRGLFRMWVRRAPCGEDLLRGVEMIARPRAG
jgi:hypothetical protein